MICKILVGVCIAAFLIWIYIRQRIYKRALIIVDMQNDFCDPQGALYVKGAEKVDISRLVKKYTLTAVSKDWHPENHYSFKENGGQWPKHCVQKTWGAQLIATIAKIAEKHVFPVFHKGDDPCDTNDYSDFSGHEAFCGGTLEALLKENGIAAVDVVGVALDYCVKATALDAAKLGFKTRVLMKYAPAVDTSPEAIEKVIVELEAAGVTIVY